MRLLPDPLGFHFQELHQELLQLQGVNKSLTLIESTSLQVSGAYGLKARTVADGCWTHP